jgi:pSer/pThr/pTyr-binding forkhead associated (FHA) protein/tetratricopeptide (TPR) repeat protein
MNRLIVTKNGKQVSELVLETGREYIIGRDPTCDIVLEAVRGISREHFRMSGDDGGYHIELLSRYGELYRDGKKVSEMLLNPNESFEVPPYVFSWHQDQPAVAVDEVEPEENQQVEFVQPEPAEPAKRRPVEPMAEEATTIRAIELMPTLRVTDRFGTPIKTYTLTGYNWTVGRDEVCTVKVDNVRFSRKHFQIRKDEGSYQITDLGSSNGTLLNSTAVFAKQWRVLSSGDMIEAADWRLYFELRDPSIQQDVDYLPQLYNSPNPGFAVPPPPIQFAKEKNPKLWVVRGLIGFLLVVGLFFYFSDGGTPTPQRAPAEKSTKTLSPLDKLKPEQRQYVKDTYRLADSLYREGRYEMARQEIAKIHQIIPSYEDSNELERLATVAIQSLIDQQKMESKEKELAEMQEKIQRIVGECRAKMNDKTELRDVDECLSPIIALSPDDPAIISLKAQAEQMVSERLVRDEKRADYQAQVRKFKNMFERAEQLEKKGDSLGAAKAYQALIASSLPDPNRLKEKGKRQLASLQENILRQQSTFEQAADDDFKKGDFRSAVQNLKKAQDLNPENESLKGRMAAMFGELKKQMQTLYQEGVLEESVGEVETAKGKWKKIIELSLPDEEYYKKAKIKLKKYGVE